VEVSSSFLTGLTGTLNQLTLNEQDLTRQLSSGLRVSSLSDDPVAAGENVSLSTEIQQDDSYRQASTDATSVLQVTDSVLASVVSQLTKVIGLVSQGSTGTENPGDLTSVATELSGMRDEILSLANTKYQGSYLFAGSKGTTQPFTLDATSDPASVAYQGDTDQLQLAGPDGSRIAISTPGSQIFTAAGNDVFNTLNQLISGFADGNNSVIAQSASTVSNLVSYVANQRAGVDVSISRIGVEQQGLQEQSTQLIAQQTGIMQADTAQVATGLSSTQTQQSALEDVIASLEKQGTLFSVIGA
jgi:flagellar hook-associated protein 3 FlgL